MAAFLKSLAKMLSPTKAGPSACLSAFGKHPGWNDHIDDLGLDTEELIAAKQLLYAQGINQSIDAGAWEKLEPAQRLSGFGHEFLWRMGRLAPADPTALLAGGFWSSVDGKGRDKYPIVLCAGLRGVDVSFATHQALPIVEAAHTACVGVSDAQGVRSIVEQEGTRLRTTVASLGEGTAGSALLRGSDVAAMAKSAARLGGPEAFARVVYQLVSALSAYRTGGAAMTGKGGRRAEQVRVPRAPGINARASMQFWFNFTRLFIDENAPLFIIAPQSGLTDAEGGSLNGGWVDVIVGEPAVNNIFCLKASQKGVPLTSDIPYTLDGKFQHNVASYVTACESAAASPTPALPAW